ncbi:ABC transporter ATP-binding protein [Actinoalloteichus fjordicus]|nr:ABC transporter ATP-binding protein [Actinoalloteichus fjordicus]
MTRERTGMALGAGDRLLMRTVSQRRGALFLLVGSGLCGTIAVLLLPAALSRGVDAAVAGSPMAAAVWVVLALAVVDIVTEILGEVLRARLVADTGAELRRGLVRHLVALGTRRHPFRPGDALSRLTSDCAEAGGAAVILVGLLTAALSALGALAALALLDWRLAVVFVLSLPPAVLLAGGHLRRTAGHVADYQRISGELAGRLVDAVRGRRTILAAGIAEQETVRVLRPLGALGEAGRGMWRTQSVMVWRAALLLPAVEAAVGVTAGFGVAAGRLTAGELLAALGYVALGMGLVRSAALLTTLASARAGAARLAEVLTTPTPSDLGLPAPAGGGRLEFDRVSVHDDQGEPALRDLTFDVPEGGFLAVVGFSGAGKSAVAAAAGGLLIPDAGEVRIDGVAVSALGPSARRAVVGQAFDRPVLIGDTVGAVVGYGGTEDESRVRSAAVAARIDDAVLRLPEGYRTATADAPFSGGEVQRLGLARALVAEPRVLVLDDATASLDTVTEAEVNRAIVTALPGRTRLVVTHRVAVAAGADRVLWLHQGSRRGLATHETLWRDPAYRAVFAEAPG